MGSKTTADNAPARLLLATDLSARCDRALERCAQLVGEWQAELIALNVLDMTKAPDQALAWAAGSEDEEALYMARRQIRRDLEGLGIEAAMRISRSSDTAGAIREVAAETRAGMVVTGVASSELFGRFLLGSTVERLARSLPIPLLVVRKRVHGAYRRIVVATDFSESSGHALRAAARLFPGRGFVLYHAYQTPFAGLADNLPHTRMAREIEQGEWTDFLTACDLPSTVRVLPAIEKGSVETSLSQYVRNHDIDLVLMGSHGRSGIMSMLLGSTAASLLDWLPCDALIVPEPRALRREEEKGDQI